MHELLLRGGTVLDGTGAAGRTADVAVDADGTIGAMGRVAVSEARQIIDVGGAVVCPGFIDLHSHADYSVFGAPSALTQVYQGVTSLVTGNCGFSPFPVVPEHADVIRTHAAFGAEGLPWDWRQADEFFASVDRLTLGVNVACLVGHGTLRLAAMGPDKRPATDVERERMRTLLRQSLDDGAVGMSSGLIYAPGSFAASAEMVELCREVAGHDRLYATHVRDETDQLLSSVDEALATARESGVRLEISHLKAIGPDNWGQVRLALSAIENAAAEGVDVATDVYPYTASATTLTSRLPDWALDGGNTELLRRLNDPGDAVAIIEQLSARIGRSILPDGVIVAATPPGPYQRFVGASIADLAGEWDLSPAGAIVELLRGQQGKVSIINHAMSAEDVKTVLEHPLASVASDGSVLATSGDNLPHPRSFGTFARVLGHYVRGQGVLSLPAAVRKMTGLPASRLGWTDRGVVRKGAIADLCVFDPAAVADLSTFDSPWRLATGVQHTFLAGIPVLADGAHTDLRPGLVIRGRKGARRE